MPITPYAINFSHPLPMLLLRVLRKGTLTLSADDVFKKPITPIPTSPIIFMAGINLSRSAEYPTGLGGKDDG